MKTIFIVLLLVSIAHGQSFDRHEMTDEQLDALAQALIQAQCPNQNPMDCLRAFTRLLTLPTAEQQTKLADAVAKLSDRYDRNAAAMHMLRMRLPFLTTTTTTTTTSTTTTTTLP